MIIDYWYKNYSLGLEIYIWGNLPEKDNIIIYIFKNKISEILKRATYKYENNQFFWIAKPYPDISENIIDLIINEIIDDINKPKYEDPISQQVILMLFQKISKY